MLEQRLGFRATGDGRRRCTTTITLLRRDPLAVHDENLRANPAIEVNVVDPSARRGYRFKGTATIHEGDDVYRRLELRDGRGRADGS